MGKREETKRKIEECLASLVFHRSHLYDRATEFDAFVDKYQLPFYGMHTVASNHILYVSNDGCNLIVKLVEGTREVCVINK